MSLPGPRTWVPTEGLKKLHDAVKLAEQELWAAVEEAIQGVKVVAPENVKELKSLGARVSAWKQQLKERLAAERRKVQNELENLLKHEPIKGRRSRIERAKKLLQEEKTRRIFAKNEIVELENRVQDADHLVVGQIRNDCDFKFSVGDMAIAPGESRVIKYDDRQSQGIIIKARGYEDREVAKELDEAVLAISNGQWTMTDVLVKIEGAAKGVECVFNGEQVDGEFKVKPGSYTLVFKRDGYESQSFVFTAKLCDGCTVTVPREWSPLPVDVSVPALDDDVKCYLGTSQVLKSVRLTPGKSYEFRYQKDDCEDQRVRVLVETGTLAIVPEPSVWVDVADVKKLVKAEVLAKNNKWKEASQLIDGVRLKASENKERLQMLRDKIDKEIERVKIIEENVDNAELADPETLYSSCLYYYHIACSNGYVLTIEDRNRVERAYKIGLKELNKQIESIKRQIGSGVRPFRDLKETEDELLQLKKRYAAMRK